MERRKKNGISGENDNVGGQPDVEGGEVAVSTATLANFVPSISLSLASVIFFFFFSFFPN